MPLGRLREAKVSQWRPFWASGGTALDRAEFQWHLYNGLRNRKVELIPKNRLSSDRGLQLAPVKSESLVMAGQLYGREYVLGSCTHRPSNGESWGSPNQV